MRIFKYLPALLIALVLLSVIIYIAFYFIFLDLIVDYWWFESLKYQAYFWLRLLYRFFLSGGVTLVFFSIFFFHFWIASRFLGLNPEDDIYLDPVKQRRFERMSAVFMSGSTKIYTPLSLILAVMIAIPFYHQWEDALLFFFGQSSGVTEPVYGRDTSFYLLSYPIYQLIQKELLLTAGILLVLVAILYRAEHVIVPNQEKNLPAGAKVHLGILVGFVMLFVVWGFLLDRYSLLYVDSHEPVFFGPGFIELRYHLPLIWGAIVSFLAVCFSAAIFVFSDKPRIKSPLIFSLLLFFSVLGLRKIDWLPNLMTSFIVQPNPVKTEQTFMKSNIEATLDAYDLTNIKTVDFTVTLNPENDIEQWSSQRRFENIPVWDRELLTDVYRQLQGIRPYYSFLSVDEDRYQIKGHTQQVNLSAREMNIANLPKEAQNWENKHLRYTHGFGAVVTPAAQDAGKPIVWYLRDLNLFSSAGLELDKPDIFYGEELYDYAIAPNKLEILGLSESKGQSSRGYEGTGIPISSLFRKLLLAFYLKEEKVFFSTNIGGDSRLLIRRNILERVNKLAPFLELDQDPYLVLTKDRFYWIIDAYTLSKWYPVSKYADKNLFFRNKEFNYIRNSVKIVIDAYSGQTMFYVANPKDVLIQAYRAAYPGVFHDLDEIPQELRTHLRYPRDLFNQQFRIYAKYHQTEPELFYQQAETWDYAKAHGKRVMPYYLTLNFGACDEEEEFVLLTPMTPISRDNLSMLGVAGVNDTVNCSGGYQPNIKIFKFLKDVQVNGPAQMEALIDQSPEISEQMTLWDQHGSKVVYGRMIILPMLQSVLYVQPIYLVSTKTEIPELSRVIVSIGNEVVMDKTLWSAFEKLKRRFISTPNDVNVSGAIAEEPAATE